MRCTIPVLFIAMAATATAQEGNLVLGGAPSLVKGDPAIRMVSQRVMITVNENSADVDAIYTLKNDGPASYIRIGFPEEGYGSFAAPYLEDLEAAQREKRTTKPFNAFVFFSLYVDGKAVEATQEAVNGIAKSHRLKLVHVGPKGTRRIRSVYRIPLGNGSTSSGGNLLQTAYDLSHGANWKGAIGEVEVLVQFRNARVPLPPTPIAAETLKLKSPFDSKALAALPRNTVYYRGFAKPTLVGTDTLRFYRKNVEPKEKDDVRLYFGYQPNKL
jgi:hypothetical protein